MLLKSISAIQNSINLSMLSNKCFICLYLITRSTTGSRRSNRAAHATHAIFSRSTIRTLGTTIPLKRKHNIITVYKAILKWIKGQNVPKRFVIHIQNKESLDDMKRQFVTHDHKSLMVLMVNKQALQ